MEKVKDFTTATPTDNRGRHPRQSTAKESLVAAPDNSFSLTFLGTGAADFDWTHWPRRGIRGSTSTLINGEVVIDFGPTTLAAIGHFAVKASSIRELWFTHSHSDHFSPENIRRFVELRGKKSSKLTIRGSHQLLKRLASALVGASSEVDFAPCEPFVPFARRGWKVTPLLGNHFTGDYSEPTLHWLVERKAKRLLYALDGAWMNTATRAAIGSKSLDCIVWDATVKDAGDWRIFEHNDLTMIKTMVERLRRDGIVKPETILILDHLARTLWPKPLRVPKPFLAARDGRVITV